MKYLVVRQPLKAKEIVNDFERTSAAFNRASSILINMMADPKFWLLSEPPAKRIEIVDLSDTFDLGLKAEFHDGQLVNWERIAVF